MTAVFDTTVCQRINNNKIKYWKDTYLDRSKIEPNRLKTWRVHRLRDPFSRSSRTENRKLLSFPLISLHAIVRQPRSTRKETKINKIFYYQKDAICKVLGDPRMPDSGTDRLNSNHSAFLATFGIRKRLALAHGLRPSVSPRKFSETRQIHNHPYFQGFMVELKEYKNKQTQLYKLSMVYYRVNRPNVCIYT